MTKRRLYFDIETSPNIGFFWQAGFKLNVNYDNIITERAIICICYKWEGEKKVHSLTWDRNQSDKKMLQDFIKVANTANELVGHNGDKFDMTWIRTRCLFHQLPAFPNYVTIDTLKFARQKFRFNSNKLDYIGKFLGLGGKIQTGFGLWKDICLNKCSRSLDKMVKYCKQDVLVLEKIFSKMNSHIPAKVHYGMLKGKLKISCPECGGETTICKTRISAAGTKRQSRQCKQCGKYCTTAA